MTRVGTLHCFIEWFAYDPRMGLKKDHLNICMATPVLNSSPKVTFLVMNLSIHAFGLQKWAESMKYHSRVLIITKQKASMHTFRAVSLHTRFRPLLWLGF